MKRISVTILVILLLMVSIVGCAKESSGDVGESLTIYSAHTQETINMYIEEFEKETGIKADIVSAGGGEIIKRIEAEKNNPMADVIVGIGVELLDANKDLLEPYETSYIDDLHEGYVEEENRWTGDFIIPMVMMYNKDLVPEEEAPETWSDLLDPKYKGQIAMADPLKSGSSYTQLATILTAFGKGDEAWDFVEELVENMDYKVLGSSKDVPKRVSDGEAAVGIAVESYAYEYLIADANIEIVYPTEGTSARSSAVGIIKDAKELENAKLFLDFVMSKKGQENVAEKFYRRPVRKDVNLSEGLLEFEKMNILNYDFDWASDNKDENLSIWKDIIVSQ